VLGHPRAHGSGTYVVYTMRGGGEGLNLGTEIFSKPSIQTGL